MNKHELENRIKVLEAELIEEKRQTQFIKEGETKFQSISNNITVLIAHINADTLKYEFVNDLFEKTFGIPRDKIIGSHVKDIIGEKNYKFALKYIKEVKSGKTVSYENTFDIASGKRWVHVNYSPVFDDNNKVIGITVVGYNIIKHKQVEEVLAQNNNSLNILNRFALELSNLSSNDNLEAFIAKQVKEITGAKVTVFTEYNSADQTTTPKHIEADAGLLKKVVNLLGTKVQSIHSVISEEIYQEMTNELIGERKNLYDISSKEIPRPVAAAIQALLKVDRFIALAYFIEGRLYGTSLLAMGKGQPNPPKEILENFIHLASVSLRRKQADKALLESKRKLLQLNADKDRFISILGHDLRSPFNSLLGLSELLSENIHKYDIDKIENIATSINKSAQRSFNLLDDLLNWARAQQGKIPFNPVNMRLTDICNDVLITLNPTAKAKNTVINCLAEDHLNIFADIDMIKTVLRNLVSNAIKFTNNGGAININAEQTDSNVTISVLDNGVGIPPENLPKLFDISEVLTTKGTAKETGTGLGLLLCKEFVEKHGGKIWVESEIEKGSKFIFSIPNI